jgi:hypothetical protein
MASPEQESVNAPTGQPVTDDVDGEVPPGPSGSLNQETSQGGADAVPDTPDTVPADAVRPARPCVTGIRRPFPGLPYASGRQRPGPPTAALRDASTWRRNSSAEGSRRRFLDQATPTSQNAA